MIDKNLPALVDLDAHLRQAWRCHRTPPDAHKHDVRSELLRGTVADRLGADDNALATFGHTSYLSAQFKLEALLLEHRKEILRHLRIDACTADEGLELDHCHLCAETLPHRPELQPDHAAADDHHLLGHRLQRQSTR